MRKLTRIMRQRAKSRMRHAGFTLVEMLVTVALVLIMMVMFTQVFVQATTSLSEQRGIAENDQRARLLMSAFRNDLDGRTFRDVLPFRANEDTRLLGHSLARRAGYFEIDEGNPADDTDDVLQFTTSVNIHLQATDASPFVGNAVSLSGVPISGVGLNTSATFPYNYITVNSNVASYVTPGAEILISFSDYNNGSYLVAGPPNYPAPVVSGGATTIALQTTSMNTSSSVLGTAYLSANEPEGDDGVFGNSTGASPTAEVCYFLRNGILYRRVLLIRDTPAGVDSQPTTYNGAPLIWNGSTGNYPTSTTSTFWQDFDYSAVYYTGNNFTNSGTNLGAGAGVRFHGASESLSNSWQPATIATNSNYMPASNVPFSLGIPNWRFGHSTKNGLPQDASTTAYANGVQVTIGRFNLQESSCTLANQVFGYPGFLPNDPISNAANTNPFDRQNIQVNPTTGLVAEYSVSNSNSSLLNTNRRGEDILLANVLTFDIKVWQAIGWNTNTTAWDTGLGQFVDLGNSLTPSGPMSANAGIWTDNNGNIVGGRLNTTYAPNNHYRFDTWHPNASVNTSAFPTSPLYLTYPANPTFINEPPYYPATATPTPPYTYNEPPYMPVTINQPMTALSGKTVFQSAPLTAIQITINYRDISSNQIRQMTMVQSLVDRVKKTSVTNQAAEE